MKRRFNETQGKRAQDHVVGGGEVIIKTPHPTDDEVMRELVHQVSKATPKGGTELQVTTFITRPMWRIWCRAVGAPPDSKPTEWIGVKDTLRVFGSKTIVLESDAFWSVSFYRKPL